MPKPKGTTGATKMKIMAIIYHNYECGRDSYGYFIWQSLKGSFHTYINEGDVRNVYHHLKELCELELLERMEALDSDANVRCFYQLTAKGRNLRNKYAPYLEILHRSSVSIGKY